MGEKQDWADHSTIFRSSPRKATARDAGTCMIHSPQERRQRQPREASCALPCHFLGGPRPVGMEWQMQVANGTRNEIGGHGQSL